MPADRSKTYDRSQEDVGNIVMLEHVNLRVPDQGMAALFYVTGLGLTRDPYLDFGARNMWINVGEQQFHLPLGPPQRIRGHIDLVVPDLEDLCARLRRLESSLEDTEFSWSAADGHVAVRCPWGNRFRVHGPGSFPRMDLGLPGVDLQVRVGAAPGIARFYDRVMDCHTTVDHGVATVRMGQNQSVRFTETDGPIAAYDGHHLAVYVSRFSGPHRQLDERGLITEESDQHQWRFQVIPDPDGGGVLTELEHEVRSLAHPMYRRPLVNRNPALGVADYRQGTERFTPR